MKYAAAQLSLALSGRRLVPPVALLVFMVIGVYAQRQNPVLASFALTTVVDCVICALLVSAVERETAGTATELLTVASGGGLSAWRGRLTITITAAVLVTSFVIAWPLVTGAFARPPKAADLLAAVLAHVACGLFGGTLALVLGTPTRSAVAFVITLLGICGSIPLGAVLGVFAGPGGVDQTLRSTSSALSLSVLAATGVTLAQAALLAVLARWLVRHRG